MQIIQCLSKNVQEPPRTAYSRSSTNNKKEAAKGDQRVKSEGKPGQKNAEQTGIVCSHLNFLKILCKKDIAKACFYGALNLRRVGSSRRRQYLVKSMKMKKEDLARGLGMISSHKAEINKVLPITDHHNTKTTATATTTNPSPSSSTAYNTTEIDQCGTSNTAAATTSVEKREKTKGDKAKTISKMKELLRWAAASKASEKGGKYITRKVLHFRNRAALKSVPDDDQLSNDTKISFRWEVESCSTTTSSAISSIASTSTNFDHAFPASLSATPIHNTSFMRSGNWITTDSEFVVLEL